MLAHILDTKAGILHLQPNAALTKEDFAALAKTVDPYIEKNGALSGIIIELAAFPGWESLGAMAAHFRFVRDHHKKVRKVAGWTDAKLGEVPGKLPARFVSAAGQHFAPRQACGPR